MTVADQITSARYDLRDSAATQYSSTMLLDFFNRALRVLDSYLADKKSDWVLSLDTQTLDDGDNSIDLPSDFSSTRKVVVGTTDVLIKKSALWILEKQQESLEGKPSYYAEHKTEMIFDRTATEDLTINTYYNAKSTTLTSDGNMPHGDEFNDSLRGAVVIIAKARNNRNIVSDDALYHFYRGAEASKNLKRSYVPKIKTGY